MDGLDVRRITLNFHNFDIDFHTGFLPRQAPISRLPSQWEAWELVLESAIRGGMKLGKTPGLSEEENEKSEAWRNRVREVK